MMEQIVIGLMVMIIYHQLNMRRNVPVFHGMNFERLIPVYLSVKPGLFNNVDYAGEDLMVDVDVGSETQNWSAVENDGWLLVIGDSPPGDDEVTIRVSVNDTGSPRQGTVTFSSTDCPNVVVTVNQMANPV